MNRKDSLSNVLGMMAGSTVQLTAGTAEGVIKAYLGFVRGVMEACWGSMEKYGELMDVWSTGMNKYCGTKPETEELLPQRMGSEAWCFREGSHWYPPVDVNEYDDEYRLKMDLPDMSTSDIRVTADNADNRLLIISGERKQEKNLFHYRAERSGRFMRKFQLPRNVDEANITAEYYKGVLCLYLPKKIKAIKIKIPRRFF